MAKTRTTGSACVKTDALGVAKHFIKWQVGAAGVVVAGSVKCGGGILVASVVRAAAGRYTITFNPQHIIGVAHLSACISTAAQTDAVLAIRPKVQGTDCILNTGGVQSMELMVNTITTAAAADVPNGASVYLEITEYTTDASNKLSVA
jgi:hypothetical protein